MLSVTLEPDKGIAVLEPNGALTKEDFDKARAVVDPYLEKAGKLNGIVVHAKSFPGWDSFGALVAHLRFVREHHQRIERVAACTDSPVAGLAQALGNAFVHAEIRAFDYAQFEAARSWAAGGK